MQIRASDPRDCFAFIYWQKSLFVLGRNNNIFSIMFKFQPDYIPGAEHQKTWVLM